MFRTPNASHETADHKILKQKTKQKIVSLNLNPGQHIQKLHQSVHLLLMVALIKCTNRNAPQPNHKLKNQSASFESEQLTMHFNNCPFNQVPCYSLTDRWCHMTQCQWTIVWRTQSIHTPLSPSTYRDSHMASPLICAAAAPMPMMVIKKAESRHVGRKWIALQFGSAPPYDHELSGASTSRHCKEHDAVRAVDAIICSWAANFAVGPMSKAALDIP